jgi:hypothetical protein
MFDAGQPLINPTPAFFAAPKRFGCVLATVAYLGALGGFLLQSALGDTAPFPLSYFFTWDMFPSHNTRCLRRVAVGLTAGGKYLQLHPSPYLQYRGGVHGDLTRVDLDARGFFYQPAVEQTLKLSAATFLPDPVTHVYLFEKSWPSKFNYPADLYQAWCGSPKPDRVWWRLVTEFDVHPPAPDDVPASGDGS